MHSISNRGPIVFTYTLFVLGEVYCRFASNAVIRRFEILKMFYAPKGLCEAEPNGVHLILSILLCLRKGVWTFRFRGGNPSFWHLENVLSLEGTLQTRGFIWESFHFIVLGKGVWTFRFKSKYRPVWNLENVLSPEGTLRSRTQWGPFDSFHFIVFEKGCLDLSFQRL